MRFHILGLAHTKTNEEYMPCAYTQKVLKIIPMIQSLGHEIIHYGAEGSVVPCEHITVVSDEIQKQAYGDYNWRKEFFKHNQNDIAYRTFNENAIHEINARKKNDDFLLIPFGGYQLPVIHGVGLYLTVEMGIGYDGYCTDFRVFESYAWMHYIYGKYNLSAAWYDAVIPNYFNVNDFTYNDKPQEYFSYIGRLIPDKGVQTAIDTSRILGMKLKIAGQGDLSQFNTKDADVEYLGTVDAKGRDELLRNAQLNFLPTQYIEPFGGTAVECQLCGTPALTTDWGVFNETVLHGITGYRCRTLDDFVWAARNVKSLDRKAIRNWAASNFSTERVSKMYGEYFFKLHGLYDKGWYKINEDRVELDWLHKQWPKPQE